MKRYRVVFPVCLLLVMTLIAIISGCENTADPFHPVVPAGSIQGQVNTGGLPVEAVIVAKRIMEDVRSTSAFETSPAEDGHYSVDVPAGRYIISVQINRGQYYFYTASGLSYGQLPADTLMVDAYVSPVEIDFDLGGMALTVDLSDQLDGETGTAILHLRDAVDTGYGQSYVDYGSTEIEDGHLDIQIPGILPGEYQVEIVLGSRIYKCGNHPPYDGEHFWMPDTRDQSNSPWYEILADSVLTLSSEVATEPARIEGRITGAWQEMGLASGPDLSIFSPDSAKVIGGRRVEDDGSFAIDLYIPGPVKLQVTQNGIRQWIGGPTFDQATVYTLQAGQTISDIELVQSGIHFFVDAPILPVREADFYFYDPTDLTLIATARTSISLKSHIGFPNLWPGDYLIYITPLEYRLGSSSWKPQWFDRATEAEQAQMISIASVGEIVPVDLTLELGGVISGIVEQGDEPAQQYYVLITPADETNCWAYDITYLPSREFTFHGLPDGDYKVGALSYGQGWNYTSVPETGVVWYPATSDWDSAGILEIRDATEFTNVDIDVQ